MADPTVVIIASFLIAFKAVLLEGTEVTVLALATVAQLGKKNVMTGVLLGVGASLLLFSAVRFFFLLLPEALVDFGTAAVLLYFSSRFLRAFRKYYFGKKSFRAKMEKMGQEVVVKGRAHLPSGSSGQVPFSFVSALPVFSITLTEGFEASSHLLGVFWES